MAVKNEDKYYIKAVRLSNGVTQYIKATVDGDGNDIVETYATKQQLSPIMPAWPAGTNGVYQLQATVVNGVPTYTWILDTVLRTTEG